MSGLNRFNKVRKSVKTILTIDKQISQHIYMNDSKIIFF